MPLYHRRKLAILLLICCSCLITPIESRSRDKDSRRRNDRVSAAATTSNYGSSYVSANFGGQVDTTGFCTRRRDMKLMCYCTPDENHVPVQKAECWVFSEGLLQNDTTWTRFYQQKRLRDLKFVVQNHGRLDYIPTMILEPMKNLSSITIEYSQVEVVKGYAFANLPYLERIVLISNQIMALDQDAFANHLRLRELNLEHNQIFEIDRYAFRNLPQCERLFLNNNNMTSLHEGLFVEMARLVYLNLAHNQISVLTSEIFKGLGNLNVLKLTHNNLNFIGDTVFAELWSLVELELDDNRIERISERALDGLNNLKTLNLRNNLLKKIDNGLLRGTPALLSINVQSNELETLTFYTFQPIMDNLVNSTSELLLSDNNFVCDCRLQWIFDLRNRTRHLQLRDALEDIVCMLQEPKLSNFVEPVPGHILALLNVGGFNNNNNKNNDDDNRNGDLRTGSGGGRKRMSKARQTATRQAARQATEVGLNESPGGTSLQKRSLPKQQQQQLDNSNAAELDGKQSTLLLHSDYYEEAAHAGMQAQQVDMEDELDLMKQNALFAQHKDVLATNKLSGSDQAAGKQPLGIKVRLFTLKPENLPCQVALSEPTELPVSRDLVDSRSNQQSNMSSKAAALWALHPLLMLKSLFVVIVSLGFGIHAG